MDVGRPFRPDNSSDRKASLRRCKPIMLFNEFFKGIDGSGGGARIMVRPLLIQDSSHAGVSLRLVPHPVAVR